MNVVIINGKKYDVLVTAVQENFNILYGEDTGRTISEGAEMFLSPLGTFIGHKITFARKRGCEAEFDALFEELLKPRSEGLSLRVVHNQSLIAYEAYVSNGMRELKKIQNNIVYWGEFEANFIPMKAQVLPE